MNHAYAPVARRDKAGRLKWSMTILAALALAAILFMVDVRKILEEALAYSQRLGPWGGMLFVATYIVAAVLLVPASVLSLGAGVLFGVVQGFVYVSVGSTLGATAAFLVGRYLARDWIAGKIRDNPTFAAIDGAVAKEGWKIVVLTRLSPVLPYGLLNYAFGLTQVRLRGYVVASWIGMMPAGLVYVYLGSLARPGAKGLPSGPLSWAFYAGGLIATVLAMALITRSARSALAKRTQPKT